MEMVKNFTCHLNLLQKSPRLTNFFIKYKNPFMKKKVMFASFFIVKTINTQKSENWSKCKLTFDTLVKDFSLMKISFWLPFPQYNISKFIVIEFSLTTQIKIRNYNFHQLLQVVKCMIK